MANNSIGNTFMRGFMRLPVAIRTLIALNTVLFLAQVVFSTFFGIRISNYMALLPHWKPALMQPWRIVTYMFVHATWNPFHFIFNMLWLWWMGRPVEEAIGSRSFFTLYFGAGLTGAIIDIIVGSFFAVSPVIGASGAVYGIMVAFAMLFPRVPIMLFLLPPIEARYVISGFIALDVLFLSSGDGVARLVHIGGALGGYLLMKARQKGFDLSIIIRYFEYLFNKMKPVAKPKNKNMHIVSDAEIIEEVDQTELDEILEKISKKGYDSLTKSEKQKLFELSKKN